jgi:hypothetical protein
MPDEPLDAQIRFAIANKRLVQLTYHGAQRVAEPHDYGLQKGLVRLLVYQLRGSNSTGRSGTRGWRLLDVPDIEDILVLREAFPGSRGHEHSKHYVWDVLCARVE